MFNIFIPYVNQRELLMKAIESLGKYKQRVIVLNNSGKDLMINGINVFKISPVVPFSVLMNYVRDITVHQKRYFFMHDDAEASEMAIEQLLGQADHIEDIGNKWGALLTNHDALALYNREAVRSAEWDINLPQYYSDWDYFRQLHLAGYPIVWTNVEVNHEVSATMKADETRKIWVETMFPAWKNYYLRKWGGDYGHETYTTPFNK